MSEDYIVERKITLAICSTNKDEEDAETDIQSFIDILISGDWKQTMCETRSDGRGYPELAGIDVLISTNKSKRKKKIKKEEKFELDKSLGITGLENLDGFGHLKRT